MTRETYRNTGYLFKISYKRYFPYAKCFAVVEKGKFKLMFGSLHPHDVNGDGTILKNAWI